MKFIIDAHLSPSLAEVFKDFDVIHTISLPEGNHTSDNIINDISLKEQRILITKDSDFYYSYIYSHKPYKLVLVKLGNMRLREMKSYFEKNAQHIVQLLNDHSFLILEIENIRVLD